MNTPDTTPRHLTELMHTCMRLDYGAGFIDKTTAQERVLYRAAFECAYHRNITDIDAARALARRVAACWPHHALTNPPLPRDKEVTL